MSDGKAGELQLPVQQVGYVGLALLMTAIAVAGFWPSYWGPLLTGSLELHWVLHIHGLVFTGWMMLLVTQAVLVYRGRTDLHMTLGRTVGAVWGLMLITIGLTAAFGSVAPSIGTQFESLAEFISRLRAPLGDMVAFVLLFGAGIVLTDRPQAHKRLMVLATVALLAAPVSRLIQLFMDPPSEAFFVSLFVLPLLPAVLAMGYDWWSRRRVHPAYWAGMVVLVANASKYLWGRTNAWRTFTADMADMVRTALLPLL